MTLLGTLTEHLKHHNVIVRASAAWNALPRSAVFYDTCAHSLLTNHVLSSLWGAPFRLTYDFKSPSLLPPKLIIKTNLASREIKPTLTESGTNSQYPIVFLSFTLASFSLPLTQPSLFFMTIFFLWPPPALSMQMNLLLHKTSTICSLSASI